MTKHSSALFEYGLIQQDQTERATVPVRIELHVVSILSVPCETFVPFPQAVELDPWSNRPSSRIVFPLPDHVPPTPSSSDSMLAALFPSFLLPPGKGPPDDSTQTVRSQMVRILLVW